MQETDPDSRGQHSGFLHHEVVEEGVEAVEGAVHSHRHFRPLHLVEYACHSCTQNTTLMIHERDAHRVLYVKLSADPQVVSPAMCV